MLMRQLPLLFATLLLASEALAQNPPPRISDEGGGKSVYFNLDCVGEGIACTTSGVDATITYTPLPLPEIPVPGGSDTYVQYNDGGTFGGDSGFTYDDVNERITVTEAITNNMGLGGTAPVANAAMSLSGTSSSLVGPLLSNFTYTGTSIVAAALQSEIYYDSAQVGPYVWGAKVASYSTDAPAIVSYNYALQADAGFSDNSQVLSAGEFAVFYGVSAPVLTSTKVGGSHSGTSTIVALGIEIPAFTTPTGAAFIKHGALMAEPVSLLSGVPVGFDASLFANATTKIYYTSGTGTLDTDVAGVTVLKQSNTQIEPQVTIDGGRNLFYATAGTAHSLVAGWTNINLTEVVEDGYYTHDNSTNPEQVNFTRDGLYRVTYNACTIITSGGNRSETECKLQEDVGAGYVDISTSFCTIYNRTVGRGAGCCSVTLLRDFDNTEDLKLQCRRVIGSDTETKYANRTRVNIEYIRDS